MVAASETVKVGTTTYQVDRLPVSETLARDDVKNIFILTGPRGAAVLVQDCGTKYKLNITGNLRGLTRAHLNQLGVEA